MAEFCLDCFNKMNKTGYTKSEVWLEKDFCEGCADWRPCVMGLRPKPFILRLTDWVSRMLRR